MQLGRATRHAKGTRTMADDNSCSTRRGFLKKGLIGGALLSASAAALSLWPQKRQDGVPTPPLKVLNEGAFWTMVAIAGRVIPADGNAVKVATAVDQALSYVSKEAQRDLNTLLGLFENGVAGVFLGGSAKPFTQRSPEDQDHALDNWATSKVALLRGGVGALRKLALASHYGDPSSWKLMGYQGPPSTGGLFYDDSRAGARGASR